MSENFHSSFVSDVDSFCPTEVTLDDCLKRIRNLEIEKEKESTTLKLILEKLEQKSSKQSVSTSIKSRKTKSGKSTKSRISSVSGNSTITELSEQSSNKQILTICFQHMERNAALEFQVKQQAEKIKSFGLEQTINNQNKEELDLLRNENKMLKEKIEEFQETEQKLKQKIEEVKNDAKRENKQIICEGKLVIAAYIEQIEKAKEENEHLIREGKIEIDALIEQNEKANLETSTLLSKIEELNGQINSFQIKNQQLQTENTNLHRSVNYKEQVIIKQQQSVLQNKWVQSHYYKCCEKRCDMDLSKSSCVNKNSFIRIRENGDVKYYIGEGDGYRSDGFPLYPKYYYTKSDHVDLTVPKYFEITIRRETYGDYKGAYAVLYIEFGYEIVLTNDSSISIGNHENFSWRDGDVFGCGYTRPNKLFFTKNGSIIDNKEYVCYNDNELGNHYDLEPRIILFRCSIETNFGNNLLNKPFRYYSTQY